MCWIVLCTVDLSLRKYLDNMITHCAIYKFADAGKMYSVLAHMFREDVFCVSSHAYPSEGVIRHVVRVVRMVQSSLTLSLPYTGLLIY